MTPEQARGFGLNLYRALEQAARIVEEHNAKGMSA
jgi:hypothetical protein